MHESPARRQRAGGVRRDVPARDRQGGGRAL